MVTFENCRRGNIESALRVFQKCTHCAGYLVTLTTLTPQLAHSSAIISERKLVSNTLLKVATTLDLHQDNGHSIEQRDDAVGTGH